MSESNRKTAEYAEQWLNFRGVQIRQIAELVYEMQQPYYTDLTIEQCEDYVRKVLSKREVLNAVLTGIQLDMMAEQKKLIEPLQRMVANDEGLYGCDEILALSIVNVYGSIGLTNFGYIDKVKPGIVGKLNDKKNQNSHIHTFLDDIIGAIAASTCSRIAHTWTEDQEKG